MNTPTLMLKMNRVMVATKNYRDYQQRKDEKTFDLGEREAAILEFIGGWKEDDGIPYVSKIVDKFRERGGKGNSQSSISQIVMLLWKKEFLCKDVDQSNSRVNTLRLTEKGLAFYNRRKAQNKQRAELLLGEIINQKDQEVIEAYMDRVSLKFEDLLAKSPS